MRKTYFVDSENVGDNWVALLPASVSEDEILVFYTLNSPHMNYKNVRLLKESQTEPTFIECFEGSNALDFQLCSEMGYRIHECSDGEFIIVSNDTGYDAVVKYWKKKHVQVKRIHGKACLTINEQEKAEEKKEAPAPETKPIAPAAEKVPEIKPETESRKSEEVSEKISETVQAEKAPEQVPEVRQPVTEAGACEKEQEETEVSAPAAEATAPAAEAKVPENAEPEKPSDPVDDNAKELLYLIGRKNLQDLHEALKQIYGEKKGVSIYNSLKQDNAYHGFLAHHPSLNLYDKQKKYCSIVFASLETPQEMPQDFSSCLMSNWKSKANLNSLRSVLHNKYGKDKGDEYYNLFKKHVRILDRLS